jgi:hypothetical protein
MKVIARNRLGPDKGLYYSNRHLSRMEKNGEFPKSFLLSPGRMAYDEEEIDRWLKGRREAGRGAAGAAAA